MFRGNSRAEIQVLDGQRLWGCCEDAAGDYFWRRPPLLVDRSCCKISYFCRRVSRCFWQDFSGILHSPVPALSPRPLSLALSVRETPLEGAVCLQLWPYIVHRAFQSSQEELDGPDRHPLEVKLTKAVLLASFHHQVSIYGRS